MINENPLHAVMNKKLSIAYRKTFMVACCAEYSDLLTVKLFKKRGRDATEWGYNNFCSSFSNLDKIIILETRLHKFSFCLLTNRLGVILFPLFVGQLGLFVFKCFLSSISIEQLDWLQKMGIYLQLIMYPPIILLSLTHSSFY